jgi:hypothetical protein
MYFERQDTARCIMFVMSQEVVYTVSNFKFIAQE